MGSNTAKLVIAEVHLAIGVAAVSVLMATGHLDSQVGAGFLGGLLGIGAGAPLVAYTPTGAPAAPRGAPGPVSTPQAASGDQGPAQAPAGAAETPAQITGTGTASAMPQAG